MQKQAKAMQKQANKQPTCLLADVESALAEYPKVPREVWIGTDSPVDKVRWLARRCNLLDLEVRRLHDDVARLKDDNREFKKLLQFLRDERAQ